MPLTEKITFKSVLQKGNRIQVPQLIRWQFKLQPDQILKVSEAERAGYEPFYAKMGKDGRIYIPKAELIAAFGKVDNLAGCLL